jgi:hypothetical protein
MDFSPKDLRRVVVFQNVIEDDLIQISQNSITRLIEEDEFFFSRVTRLTTCMYWSGVN